jgi:selenocysteine lyase/cysteine desulfurase
VDTAFLREQIVGADSAFKTPFGERLMVYADYTASGRCLLFIENYLQSLQRRYANTHTEDDVTGRSMSMLLHHAEHVIKASVNAGPEGCVIAAGTGASGAIYKLQQILGVAYPPATRAFLARMLDASLGATTRHGFEAFLGEHQPVVFVGPYEHHSNEVSWRQGLATVIETRLAADGGVDLGHLEALLKDPGYQGRPRIGSFSAASNVTGMLSPVHDIAALLHAHGAIACFDYAASAPYVPIDMNPPPVAGQDRSLDAVFISPHKFLGGPGSSGVVIFNRRLYDTSLPPTVAAGGTVEYVSPDDQEFIADIEEREKAGTPGVLQTIKAAMAFMVKDAIGTQAIGRREHELLLRAMDRWGRHPGIEILGNPDPDRRIPIVSFNLRTDAGHYLHPKFVTALLNDLFGIQSRAGCSCAGPYGHRLLGIQPARSARYRHWIMRGFQGIKPGWCRVGFHFAMDDAEADYIIDAVLLLAAYGRAFLPLYHFEPRSGTWTHRENPVPLSEALSMDAALAAAGCKQTALSASARADLYARYLAEARDLAARQDEPSPAAARLPDELGDLQFFDFVADPPGRG